MASHVLAWSCTVCHRIFLTQEEAAVHHLSCKDQVVSGSQHVAVGEQTDGSVSVILEDSVPIDTKEEVVLDMDYNQVVTTSSGDYITLDPPHYDVIDIVQAVAAEETTITTEPVPPYDSQLSSAVQSIVSTTPSPVKEVKTRRTTIKLCRASQEDGEILETIDPSMISLSTTKKAQVPKTKDSTAPPRKADENGPPYVCKVCAASFESRTVRDMHWKSEHYVQSKKCRYKCSSCARSFRKQDEFVKHEEAHASGRKMHKCDECDYEYAIELGLKAHFKTVHAAKDKICPVCQRGFSHQGYLNNHMLAHSNTKPYQCTTCGQFFKTSHILGFHRKLHIDEKCAHCDMVFTWKPAYEKHILTHTRKKQLECRTCGKILCRLQQFKIHTANCEKKEHKPKLCRLCGKYFSDYHEYRKHKEQHPKPTIECEKCRKCFYTESNLDSHMKIHTQNSEFECKRCCIKFKFKDSLRHHINSRGHKIGKSFVCPICKRGFFSVQILNLHMKVHVRKTCVLCGEVSLGATGHQKHRQEKHPDGSRNLECATCSLKFPSLENLADHEKYYCQGKKWQPAPKESEIQDVPGSEIPAGDKSSENIIIPKQEKVVLKGKRKAAPVEVMCTYCGVNFSMLQNLRYHMRQEHDVPYIYKCRLCEKYFEKRQRLEDHVGEVHNTSKKTLMKNENTGTIQMVIENVLSTDTASCVYTCAYCRAEFDEKSKMEGHVSTCTVLSESGESPSLAEFYKIDKGEGKGKFTYECVNCEKKFDKRTTVEEHVQGCLLKGKQSSLDIAGSPLVATGFKMNEEGSKLNTTWSRVNTSWSPPSTAEKEAYDGYNKILRRHVLIENENIEDSVETIYATYSTQRVAAAAESAHVGPEEEPAEKPAEGKSSEELGELESGEKATEPVVAIKQPTLVYFNKEFHDPVAIMERWEGMRFTAKDFLISDDEELDPVMIAEDEKLLADWKKEKEEQGLKHPEKAERRRKKKLKGEEMTSGRMGRSPGSKGNSPTAARKRVRPGRTKAKKVPAGSDSDSDASADAIKKMLTDMGTRADQVGRPIKSTHIVIEKAMNPMLAVGAVLKSAEGNTVCLQTPRPLFPAGGKTVTLPNSAGDAEAKVPRFTLTLSGIKPGTNQLHGFISLGQPKTPGDGDQAIHATTPNVVKAKSPTVINLNELKGHLSKMVNSKNSAVSSSRDTPAKNSAHNLPTALPAGIRVIPIASSAKKSATASNAEALRNMIRSGKLPSNGAASKNAKLTTNDESYDDSNVASETDDIMKAATNLSKASAEKNLPSAQTNRASATKRKPNSPVKRTERSSIKKVLEFGESSSSSRAKSSGLAKRRKIEIKRTKSGRRSVPKFRFDEEFVSGDELDDDREDEDQADIGIRRTKSGRRSVPKIRFDEEFVSGDELDDDPKDEDQEDDFVGASGQDDDDDDDDGHSGGSGFGDDDDDNQVPSSFDDNNDDDVSMEVTSGTIKNQGSQARVQTPSGSGIQTRKTQNLSGIKKLQITSKPGQPNLTNVVIEYKSDPKHLAVPDQSTDALFKPEERLTHQVKKKILASPSVKEVLRTLIKNKGVKDSSHEVASPGPDVGNKIATSKEQDDSTVGAGVENKVAGPKVDEIASKDGNRKVDLTNTGSPNSVSKGRLSSDEVSLGYNPSRRSCTICGSIFETLAEFSEHTASHFKGTKWQCLYCSQSIHCDFLTHLGHHMMCWRTGRLKKNFKCPQCETLTSDSVLFEAHIRNHARLGEMSARDFAGDCTSQVDDDGKDKDNDEEEEDVGREENDESQDAEKAREESLAAKLTKTDKIPVVLLEKLDLMEKLGLDAAKKLTARRDNESGLDATDAFAATTDSLTATTDAVTLTTDATSATTGAVTVPTDAPAGTSVNTNESPKTVAVGEEVREKRIRGRPKKKRFGVANEHLAEEKVTEKRPVKSGPNVSKQKTYTCQKCSTSYENATGLQEHLLSHTLSVAFWKCGVCQEAFRSLDTYSKHVRDHARLIPVYACNVCATKFASQKELNVHIKKHVRRNFVCGDCDKVFQTMDELTYHDETGECHQARKLKCPQCNLQFKKAADLGQHLIDDVCAHCVVCSKCEMVFLSRDHLLKHDCAASTKTLACPKCAEVFKSEMEFAEHFLRNACSGVPEAKKALASPASRTGTRSSDFGLGTDCGFRKAQDDDSEEEDNIPLAKTPRKRACGSDSGLEEQGRAPKAKKASTKLSIADRGVKLLENIPKAQRGRPTASSAVGRANDSKAEKAQTKTSNSDKVSKQLGTSQKEVHVCNLCGRTFRNHQNLSVHEPSCALKPFGCDNCKRRFDTSKHLSNHQCKVLKSIFDCKLCGKQYRNRKSLRRHPCTKTYCKCERCKRRFVTQKNYQQHLCCIKQVFRCQKCTKQVQSRRFLREHYKVCGEWASASITCPECQKGFPTKDLYRWHLEGKFCGREVFDCSKCGREFHKKNHKCTVPQTFVCTRCGTEFHHVMSARKHRCNPARYECKKCDKKFATRKGFISHKNSFCRFVQRYHETVTGEVELKHKSVEDVMEPKLSECLCCFYVFGTQKDLADHYCDSFGADSDLKGRMCKAGNWIHCSGCGGNFGSKKEFKAHDCKAMGRKKCPGCGSYGLEKKLEEDSKWRCRFCDADFVNFENFAANSGIVVRFECTTCLKNFDTTELLTQHDCSQLSCLACKEIFRSAVELEEHVAHCRMKCTSCKQVFETEDDLAGHVLGTDLNSCLGAYMPKKAASK
ncbi:uncharacterized protein LOC135498620 [Lineus longissimus]|uniref:uncharacterized protein LOC135498620 n=1 Tax=Lineus longissimus TaxID=88925 RepID=UPI00315D8FE9